MCCAARNSCKCLCAFFAVGPVDAIGHGPIGGLVYLSTVLGGWIADRLLGMERTVLWGGVVVMCGHIALAIVPGLAGVAVGLVLVALGSGALKANASSLLGTLYDKGDARCDGGFTLFYLGINLGAFIGPLITGLLQTRVGFHYGFGAAAVGMTLGLVQSWCSGAIWALMAAQFYWLGCRRHRGRVGGLFRGNAHQLESCVDRANACARLHSVVHRECGVLVAVPADLHGVGGLIGRADELVHIRLDRAVELDRARSNPSGSSRSHRFSRSCGRGWAIAHRPLRGNSPTG